MEMERYRESKRKAGDGGKPVCMLTTAQKAECMIHLGL